MNKQNLLEIVSLYDIYKPLLTKKQCQYFEDYYFYDLTINEIGLKYNVSKNAIHDSLTKILNELKKYEDLLGLCNKQKKRLKLYKKINDEKLLKNLLELEGLN